MAFQISKELLEERLKNVKGKSLGTIDEAGVFKRYEGIAKVTGIAGHVIEESVIGYPPDSKQEPDLDVINEEGHIKKVELKTTGLKRKKQKKGSKKPLPHTFEAKEPMSITAVAPETIINEPNFFFSHFYDKIQNLLFVYYLYDSETTVKSWEYADFVIQGHAFFSPQDDDLEKLKHDWELVWNFIRTLHELEDNPEDGYPNISTIVNKQTMVLDTAPKWPNRPRFRFRRKFVTYLAHKHLGKNFELLEETFNTYEEFDNRISELSSKYKGMSITEIGESLGFKPRNSKAVAEQALLKMFDAKSTKLRDVDEFAKLSILVKTIILKPNGDKTEDMKFNSVDFDEWTNDKISFEDSEVYEFFNETQFLFAIFKEPHKNAKLGETIFQGFKRFRFTDALVQDEIRKTWEDVRELVNEDKLEETLVFKQNGEPYMNPSGTQRTQLNFPKSTTHELFFRGTGTDSTRKPEEVNGIKMYKQYYWIHGQRIVDRLKNLKYL